MAGSEKGFLAAPMTPMERQLVLESALKIDPGVSRFSLRAFHMYLITLVACCCSGDSGFDGTVMGGINSMTQYQHFFHMTGVGSKTSIVFGIYTIGSICGTIPASWLPDRFGRRFSMLFGNLILCFGAIITANAKSQSMFLGGRFLSGLGSSCAGASAKSYLAELSPPQSRGAYLGFLNSFYYIGQIAASGMMVSTGKWSNDMSWRLPIYIQLVPAAINVLFVFLCPESPRWLYSIGKSDQARAILARLHSSNGNIESPLVNLEMLEIEEKIQVDGVDKIWWDFRPLFMTRADRQRAYMVILIGTFGQLSGNGLITYFLPVLLQNAGIVDQNRRLTLNFVNSVTSYLGALAVRCDSLAMNWSPSTDSSQGSAVIDRLGRRKVLLSSTIIITCILAISTGLLSSNNTGNVAQSNAGITFIFLFMVVFSFGWTPMQALYPAEVLNYESRAKGLAFLGIVSQAATCINTFGLPVALERIAWKVYIIFLAWNTFEVVVIYCFVVETKGLTLEEINDVFAQPNPKAYSLQLRRETRESDVA